MTTLGQLSERIRRLYYGGNIPDDAEIHEKDIARLVIDACNLVLKTEQVKVSEPMKDFFPPHALIATYNGIAVTNTEEPELSLVCTPIVETGITTGTPTLTVVPYSIGDNDYYDVCFANITLGETTAAAIEAFINASSDSCAIEFVGLTSVPDTFLSVGITDLEVTSTSICFTYFPETTPESWITAGGEGWIVEDGFSWVAPSDSDGVEFTVPTLIANHVEDTHTILAGLTTSTTYPNSTFTNINNCCIATDEGDIDAELTLPAIPVQLARNLGVWRIWSDTLGFYEEFIPVRSGELSLTRKVSHTGLKTYFGGKVTYEWKDYQTIRINSPISVVGSTVNLQLLIVDPNTLALTDMLPLHPDMQDQVVKMVLQNLGVVPELDNVNDDQDSRV
jgi:hypothetical protein